MKFREFARALPAKIGARLKSSQVDRERFRAVFLHLPKTAGISVRHILGSHDHVLSDIKQPWLGWKNDYSYKEFSEAGFAATIRQRLGEEIWDRCFTCSIVRNPWDRAVSNWRYLTKGPALRGTSFGDFLSIVEKGAWQYSPSDMRINAFLWHVEPLYPMLVDADGKLLVDFVGRLENLQADFDHICDSAGVARSALPKLNTTEHAHYTTYYDDDTRSRVAEIYAKDIELFGYTFGSPAAAA